MQEKTKQNKKEKKEKIQRTIFLCIQMYNII